MRWIMLSQDDVLAEFRACGALLEGHFILSSGRSSPVFFQKALVFAEPARTERLCAALAKTVRQAVGDIDVVVSPAVGGIVPGYETARHLDAKAYFVEREGGAFQLRRGFVLHPKDRILVIEDVVTTGGSARECLDAIATLPGQVKAVACLIDRSNGAAQFSVPFLSLAQVNVPSYAAGEAPPELAAIPAVKPGSRHIQGAS
jgi:orotate phosphoribosyltransferase